jgi:2-oxoisovalerate dehydrogenase E1 component
MRTGKLMVVHEDNLICGFGAEVIATVSERVKGRVMVRRVARHDTYVPCNFANQLEVLPSFKRILTAAAEMLDLELTWEQPPPPSNDGLITLEALGSSPADESVTIVIWKIKPGDRVETGQHIADAESDKTIFEMNASRSGVVKNILVAPGQTVPVGTPLLRLRVGSDADVRRPAAREELIRPGISRRMKTQATPPEK